MDGSKFPMETAPTHTTHLRQWRTKELLVASFVIAFIMIQLMVPALKFTESHLTRFGWQM
jgi:hypothetical protein